jgi:hypothetical protein
MFWALYKRFEHRPAQNYRWVITLFVYANETRPLVAGCCVKFLILVILGFETGFEQVQS